MSLFSYVSSHSLQSELMDPYLGCCPIHYLFCCSNYFGHGELFFIWLLCSLRIHSPVTLFLNTCFLVYYKMPKAHLVYSLRSPKVSDFSTKNTCGVARDIRVLFFNYRALAAFFPFSEAQAEEGPSRSTALRPQIGDTSCVHLTDMLKTI